MPNAKYRAWLRIQSLFVPSVSVTSVLTAKAVADDPAAVVLQLYAWERERLLTLAKGIGGAAVTVLAALIADATSGGVAGPAPAVVMAGVLIGLLMVWGGFILSGLRRLAEQYAIALQVVS